MMVTPPCHCYVTFRQYINCINYLIEAAHITFAANFPGLFYIGRMYITHVSDWRIVRLVLEIYGNRNYDVIQKAMPSYDAYRKNRPDFRLVSPVNKYIPPAVWFIRDSRIVLDESCPYSKPLISWHIMPLIIWINRPQI